MLVLRRRPSEVIIFEGGLSLTVVEVEARRAWLGFESAAISSLVEICPLESDAERAILGVRSPTAVSYGTRRVDVSTLRATDPAARAYLALVLEQGDTVGFEGLSLELVSLDGRRPTFGVDADGLAARVLVSVHSITGTEVRIGIDAPDSLRVYRKELWVELLGANQAAAGWTTGDLDELLPPEPPR